MNLKNLQVKYELFDFRNLKNHPERLDETNKNVLCIFLRETPKSVDIKELPALSAKVFAFTCDSEEDNKKRTGGIAKAALKEMNFNTYEDCLKIKPIEQDKNIKSILIRKLYVRSTVEKDCLILIMKENIEMRLKVSSGLERS